MSATLRPALFLLAFGLGLGLGVSVGEAGSSSLRVGPLGFSAPGGTGSSEAATLRRGAFLPGSDVVVEALLDHPASGSFEVSWSVELTPVEGGAARSLGSGSGWRVASYSDQDLAVGVQIPQGLAPGRYDVELSVLAGSRRLTTSATCTVGEAADLELGELTLTTHPAGATIRAGQRVGVRLPVKNLGRRSAGWSTLDLRFSRNDAITAYDPDGGELRIAPLSPGEERVESFELVIPRDLTGSYYLGARVDAGDEVSEVVEGGAAHSAQPIRIDPPGSGPDLRAVSVEALSARVAPGDYLSVRRVLENTGELESGSVSYALYLSTDDRIDAGDRRLWTGTLGSLDGGERSSSDVRVRLAASIQPGAYRIGLKADPDDQLPESREDDNEVVATSTLIVARSQGALPDLRVVAIQPETYTTRPGDRLRVARTLDNAGGDSGAFSYTLVLSRDERIDASDPVIYTYRYYDGLTSGETKRGTVSATIPSSTRPGRYWVGLRLDPDDEVDESSEAGHQQRAPFAIRVDRGNSVLRFDPSTVHMNDGDTVRADGQSYRLLGYDTPEKRSGAYIGDQEPYGTRATNHARSILANGHELALHLGDRDQYGRILAHAFVDGQSMAVLMVEAEHAYETIRIFGNGGFYELSGEILDAARGRNPPFQEPYRWRQQHKRN